MNRIVSVNIMRFIVLVLLQSVVLKRITFDIEDFGFFHILVYPLFIFMLPIKVPRAMVILLGFVMGISIDFFYSSPGVHAGALVFTSYLRSIVLRILQPYGGYNVDASPSLKVMGLQWFITYVAILLFIHIFIYFSLEAFSFVYIYNISMNTIFSYLLSFTLIIISQIILRPQY